MTGSKDWLKELPEFDMSGIKELDTSGLATFDDILPPAAFINRVCPGCGSTFRAYAASTQIWCSDRCGWRMRKRRQRER